MNNIELAKNVLNHLYSQLLEIDYNAQELNDNEPFENWIDSKDNINVVCEIVKNSGFDSELINIVIDRDCLFNSDMQYINTNIGDIYDYTTKETKETLEIISNKTGVDIVKKWIDEN